MSRYNILVRILDGICEEARSTKYERKYAVGDTDPICVNAARGRAYIHLYLKVMFGLPSFQEREQLITDGSNDGGIDGYFIDEERRRIYILQSKFRANEKNFESKFIETDELIVMDIDRITSGYESNDMGEPYNGKILGLIRAINSIKDIARYNYHIAIIANCNLTLEQVRRLTAGHRAEIFDFEKSYRELVFPMISGTYFKAEDLRMQIDLSNKSAGARTNYQVSVNAFECEITVLFLPTIEIARSMERYKNSILEYNPRSYLDLDGKTVNQAIRGTMMQPDSNEFALLNNGLTILSDETNINERVGQKNKAFLQLVNPQIINGGQTAYTLSRIYQENCENPNMIFDGKEVLVKIITLTPKDENADNSKERLALIDEISLASNRQTAVINADRHSNDSIHKKVQGILFKAYGMLYERKRGEFSDGILAGYIEQSDIIERNLLVRLVEAIHGELNKSIRKRAFLHSRLEDFDFTDGEFLCRLKLAYGIFQELTPQNFAFKRQPIVLAKVFVGASLLQKVSMYDVERLWQILVDNVATRRPQFVKIERGEEVFLTDKWSNSGLLERDAASFVYEQLLEQGREMLARSKWMAILDSDVTINTSNE